LIEPKPNAFDVFANDYDDNFSRSTLGRLLRPRVWEKLAEHFKTGQHVLDLACGTGEDAVWLAQGGVQVTATDGSIAMVKKAKVKAEAKGIGHKVDVKQVSLQEITNYQSPSVNLYFDGAYSNFGGLNTIADWQSLAEGLSKIIRPGGKVILVPMGPFCPWEILWYLGHGQPQVAFRRFRQQASARIGDSIIPIWYPAAKRLQSEFAPWFEHLHTESLGLWLPPSYLDHFVNQWPKLSIARNHLETLSARRTKGWGDHYIIVFQRRG